MSVVNNGIHPTTYIFTTKLSEFTQKTKTVEHIGGCILQTDGHTHADLQVQWTKTRNLQHAAVFHSVCNL